MERKSTQPTFLDSLTADLGGKRTAKFFEKCNELIPWSELAEPLKDMYRNNTNKGGASNYPVVMMVKCMLEQMQESVKLFHLLLLRRDGLSDILTIRLQDILLKT